MVDGDRSAVDFPRLVTTRLVIAVPAVGVEVAPATLQMGAVHKMAENADMRIAEEVVGTASNSLGVVIPLVEVDAEAGNSVVEAVGTVLESPMVTSEI